MHPIFTVNSKITQRAPSSNEKSNFNGKIFQPAASGNETSNLFVTPLAHRWRQASNYLHCVVGMCKFHVQTVFCEKSLFR